MDGIKLELGRMEADVARSEAKICQACEQLRLKAKGMIG